MPIPHPSPFLRTASTIGALAIILTACGSDDGNDDRVPTPTPGITVGLSLDTDTVYEDESTPLTWIFTCSATPPASGVSVRLSGNSPSIITQWDLASIYAPGATSGLAGIPEDVSPASDFSEFLVTITDRVGSFTLPVFPDGATEPATVVVWTIQSASGESITPGQGSATVTIFDAMPAGGG